MKDYSDYSLLKHNTFGIDARCSRFLEYENREEAAEVARMLREREAPFMMIGAGSNLLLTRDYEGMVVHAAVKGISLTIDGNTAWLRCGSGETWDDVVAWTVGQGIADLACLSLIPGDVGASAVQNIGAYGSEAAQFIAQVSAVEIATGNHMDIGAADCHYGYRDSRFKHEWKNRFLITHVTYKLQCDRMPSLEYGNIRAELDKQGTTHPTPLQLRQAIIDIRQAKLPEPSELGNAGSFFMNPVVEQNVFERLAKLYPGMPHYYVNEAEEKIPAGWLIEQCGWKGRSMGRAGVYAKQALVLVNLGGATGTDIKALYEAVQHDVKEKFGIWLKPEVNII